jgi:serine/threonine protein kinase
MDAHAKLHPTDHTLSSYGLGKLDDALAEAVNQHLETCDSCRRRVAELSSDEFLGRLQPAKAMPDRAASGWSPSAGSSTDGSARPVAPPSVETLPPELVDHPDWEIVRELGRGGMGVVYLANNRLMGRPEVLKVVGRHLIERPGVADRFLREIRSAAKLQHPNIVTAYSARHLGQSLVFAMEYVKGFDLSKLVKSHGPLPITHSCHFIHQAALGLQHALENDMVHRDIKPANLIVREGKKGILKVLDFGLAKVTSEGQADSNLTREGQMVGTPDFIAPEQIRDAKSADIRADIYSLGCTLYYLLSGGPPFRGEHLWDIYQAHFSMDAGPLNLVRPEVPVELAAVVAKLMAKEPGRRFQEPGEAARALTPFFKPVGSRAHDLSAEVARVETQVARTEPSSAASAPTQPKTLVAVPAAAPRRPSETKAGVAWDSLIDIKETERSVAPAPAVVPARWLSRLWPSAVIGLLMFGLFAAWLGGVLRLKTPEGVIVLENLPSDAQVYVDGKVITLQRIDGKKITISIAAGKKQRLQVKKDGFTTFGEDVEIEAEGRQSIVARLEPLPDAAAKPASARLPVDEPEAIPPNVKTADNADKPAGTSGPVDEPKAIPSNAKKADYDAIATGKWIPVLEKEMDLQNTVRFVPDQMAGDVIIRAKVKKVDGQNLNLSLRAGQGWGYDAWFNGGDWFGIYKGGKGPNKLAQWHAPINYDGYFEFAFSAVGETLTIYADGNRIGDVRDPDYRLGSLRIGARRGQSVFKDVEIMILDKSAPSTAGKGFVPLFNGKDLSGWESLFQNGSEWNVMDDGVLEGRGGGAGKPAVLVT